MAKIMFNGTPVGEAAAPTTDAAKEGYVPSRLSDANLKAVLGGSTYDIAVQSDKPVGYWSLSGGLTTAADRAGASLVTFTGTPGVAAMPNGDAAVVFDGTSQYATVPDQNAYSVSTTGQLTLELWYRPDVLEFPSAETSTDGNLVYPLYKGNTTGPGGNIEYAMRMYSQSSPLRSNRTSAYVFNAEGALGAGSYVQEPLNAGEWLHLVAVFDGVNKGSDGWGTVTLYKNGVQRDQDSWGDPYNIVPANGNSPIYLGARPGHSFFKGAMGKFAVYNKALTAAQIANHYAAMQGDAVPAPGVQIGSSLPLPNGVPVVGSTGAAADAGHVHQRNTWSPADNNLLGASDDPSRIASNSALLAGSLILVKVPLLAGGKISNVAYGFNTAGAALTAGQNLVGVYNSAGTLIGTSADQTASYGSTGSKTTAITAVSGQSLTLPAGSSVYVAFLCNGTTPPTLWRVGNQNSAANFGLTAGNYRFGSFGTGLTALPATITLTSMASVSAFWAGVS